MKYEACYYKECPNCSEEIMIPFTLLDKLDLSVVCNECGSSFHIDVDVDYDSPNQPTTTINLIPTL